MSKPKPAGTVAAASFVDTATIAEVEDPSVRLDILDRRLEDPFGIPAAPVDLRDASMFPRWFNNALSPDKFWIAKANGWRGVRPDEVRDLTQIGNYNQSPEGYITRGERGNEMLMQVPLDFWKKLTLAKAKKNLDLMRDTSKQSTQALEAAARELGPEVAEQMRGVQRRMDITDNYERVERTGDAQ